MSASLRPIRLGVIYPGPPCAVDEYIQYPARAALTVELFIESTQAADSHAVADLLDAGDFERLIEGGRRLAASRPDVILWACTSASFVFGADGARRQSKAIAGATGVSTTSTSLAFVAALECLGASRVAVLGPYPVDLVAIFLDFLADNGVDVVSHTAMGSPGGSYSAGLTGSDFAAALDRLDLDDVDAVLLPDTAAFGLAAAPALEIQARRPVLAANQVGLWHALRLAGAQHSEPLFGVLADTCLTRLSG